MRIRFNNNVRRYQEGGPMPVEGGEAPQQGQDPVMELVQMAQQALEGQDCQAAMAVCDGLLQLVSGGQGGGQAAPAGPEGAAPAPEAAPEAAPEEGEPVYRRGGRLIRRGY